MKTLCLTAASVIGVVLVGCATHTPSELKNARTAYQEAVQCPGAPLAAPDVYEAKKSLDVAERAFADDGDAPETRDLAYVAERKSEIARSRCNTALAIQQQREAMAEADRLKQQQEMAMRQQLGQTKEQLEQSQSQLESERQARAAAEAEANQAHETLTINGSALFATGKSTLLPTSQKRLSEVAAALKDRKAEITVVGHTDSVGDEAKNMTLSEERAESVKNYLTTHGVAENRVKAKGVGESEPIASNKTAEGRANNRRVEIVLTGEGVKDSGIKGKKTPMQQKKP